MPLNNAKLPLSFISPVNPSRSSQKLRYKSKYHPASPSPGGYITKILMGKYLENRSDRLQKYGFGTIRLFLLLLLLMRLQPSAQTRWNSLINYGIFGVGGALLNLHALSTIYQIFILVILGTSFVKQYLSGPGAVLVLYFLKTVVGDWCAGKLDQKLWFRSLTVAAVIWVALSQFAALLPDGQELVQILREHVIIFCLHAFCHFLCETGDNSYEDIKFFRHRYTYDLLSLLLFVTYNYSSSSYNRELVICDMIASLSYRFTNFMYTVLMYK